MKVVEFLKRINEMVQAGNMDVNTEVVFEYDGPDSFNLITCNEVYVDVKRNLLVVGEYHENSTKA